MLLLNASKLSAVNKNSLQECFQADRQKASLVESQVEDRHIQHPRSMLEIASILGQNHRVRCQHASMVAQQTRHCPHARYERI